MPQPVFVTLEMACLPSRKIYFLSDPRHGLFSIGTVMPSYINLSNVYVKTLDPLSRPPVKFVNPLIRLFGRPFIYLFTDLRNLLNTL